ncbi:uncharacterized protein RSE6_02577 [Rhynchosporium secalis]|uniref:Uncharacterized protein n=1 Tax=Rhynchosporium secalis TaxID=38038 RepID=A0A1E1M0J2_RHYSE|nr:uncharacterized protein RSE6_02577 [Rhynchosporium secalis]
MPRLEIVCIYYIKLSLTRAMVRDCEKRRRVRSSIGTLPSRTTSALVDLQPHAIEE